MDATNVWEFDGDLVKDFVKGRNVLDIGCGKNGGLSETVFDMGAESYTGVDIDESFIEQSKKLAKGEFIYDDPVYVLGKVKNQPLIISSGVFDSSVLNSWEYSNQLIKAIYEAMKNGDVTLHTSGYVGDYNNAFLSKGFQVVEKNSMMGIYRKV